MSISIRGPGFVSASADGSIKVWSEGFQLRESLSEHDGSVLSLTTSGHHLISGSNDHSIKFWDIPCSTPTFEHFRRPSGYLETSASSGKFGCMFIR